jgi:hypothetical protein
MNSRIVKLPGEAKHNLPPKCGQPSTISTNLLSKCILITIVHTLYVYLSSFENIKFYNTESQERGVEESVYIHITLTRIRK